MRRAIVWLGAAVVLVVATGGLLWLATSGAASFRVDGDRLIVSGQLTLMSTERIDTLTDENPDLRVLVLDGIDAASDPTAMIQKGRLIRSLGMDTVVAAQTNLTGPAVYLYLGGVNRSLGSNATIGVSDWQTTAGPASRLSMDHPAHSERRVYVADMLGRPDFYDIMIEAAPVGETLVLPARVLAEFDVVTTP